MKIFLSYLATLIPLTILDAIWLVSTSKSFYAKHLGFLFSKTFNFIPIVFFYPLYALAVLFLAVLPAVASESAVGALWRGALLGLAAYGAYDLSNHATIAGWPVIITVVDIIWGMAVTALTSLLAYWIINAFK